MALALAVPMSKASKMRTPLKDVTAFVKRVRSILKKKVIFIWNSRYAMCTVFFCSIGVYSGHKHI